MPLAFKTIDFDTHFYETVEEFSLHMEPGHFSSATTIGISCHAITAIRKKKPGLPG